MALAAVLPARVVSALSLATARSFFAISARVAPRVSVTVARRLFCTPHGRRRVARPDTLPPAEEVAFSCDGEIIRGYAWGAGFHRPRVLLAHGWAGYSLQLASFVVPLLNAGFAVMAFDLPAHGRSSGRTATLPGWARAIRLAADSFGPLHAIIGHSLGGAAAAIALAHGMAAARAVLIAAPADWELETSRFARFMCIAERVRADMQRALEEIEGVKMADLQARVIGARIAIPALLIHDRDDQVVRYQAVEQYVSAWQASSICMTTGLGHYRILREPRVIDEVVRFLSAGAPLAADTDQSCLRVKRPDDSLTTV
jgi:pimeloyl-ACP methyl ester carboxylesterase